MSDNPYEKAAHATENVLTTHVLREAAERLTDMAKRVERGEEPRTEDVNALLEYAEAINEL